PLNTRCSRKWAMPFSLGRSLRAPASNATRIVSARVPGIEMRWTGRSLPATTVLVMMAMRPTLEGVSADPRRRSNTLARRMPPFESRSRALTAALMALLPALLALGLWLGGHPDDLPGFVRSAFVAD